MTNVTAGSSTALEEAVANAAVGAAKPGKTLQDEIRALTPQLAAGIPPGTLTPERFTRMMLTEIRKTPKLLECTRESFLGAMMQVAQLGLEIGSTLGEAYLIPYWNQKLRCTECQLQIGYKGYISLAYRGGIIMESREVYENDDFDFDFAVDPPYHHRWKLGQNRGQIIGYYGTARMPDGRVKFHVMSIDEIEQRRARAGSKDNGPWKTDYTAMARKTVIRAMVPQTPMSTELSLAIKVDDATIIHEKTGDLKVTYQDAIDIAALDPAQDDLKSQIVEALNMMPNAERLDANRHLLARFGSIEEMSNDGLREALDVVQGWPDTRTDLVAPKADANGEIIDASSSSTDEALADLKEVLDGLPRQQRIEADEALARFSEGKAFDPQASLDYLNDWLDAEPVEDPRLISDEALAEAERPRASAPAAASKGDTGDSGGVSSELLEKLKKAIDTWPAETCKQKLSEWDQAPTGSVAAMRAKLLLVLAPAYAAGNQAARDLF